jgi:hypothetical protein
MALIVSANKCIYWFKDEMRDTMFDFKIADKYNVAADKCFPHLNTESLNVQLNINCNLFIVDNVFIMAM